MEKEEILFLIFKKGFFLKYRCRKVIWKKPKCKMHFETIKRYQTEKKMYSEDLRYFWCI